jgi:hypothetical protein
MDKQYRPIVFVVGGRSQFSSNYSRIYDLYKVTQQGHQKCDALQIFPNWIRYK